MGNQKKRIHSLLELIKENPDLEIMPIVDYDVVCDDSFQRWIGGWGKAEIDEYYHDDEVMYIKSQSFDDLVEKLWDNNIDMDEEEIKEIVERYVWKKAIFVQITTP